MIKRLSVVVLLALVISILNTGCYSSNIKGEAHKSFSNARTENLVYKIQLDKRIKYIDLDIEANIKKGDFKFTINDPDGEIYRSMGTDKDTRAFDINFKIESPKKGDWEIILELDEAIGEYRASWKAK